MFLNRKRLKRENQDAGLLDDEYHLQTVALHATTQEFTLSDLECEDASNDSGVPSPNKQSWVSSSWDSETARPKNIFKHFAKQRSLRDSKATLLTEQLLK